MTAATLIPIGVACAVSLALSRQDQLLRWPLTVAAFIILTMCQGEKF